LRKADKKPSYISKALEKSKTSPLLYTKVFLAVHPCLLFTDEKVHKATVRILAEEVQESNYTITMQLYCTNLEKKDFFGKVSCT